MAIEGLTRRNANGEPCLYAAKVTKLSDQGEPARRRISVEEAIAGRHSGTLVTVNAPVASLSVEPERDVLYLASTAGPLLRAYTRRPGNRPSLIPQGLQPGQQVEISGVLLHRDDGSLTLRFRSASDIEISQTPYRNWSVLSWLAVGLLSLIALSLSYALVLRRSVREKTSEIRALLEQARASSRLKSEFLAMMSHEIRTPLHGVLGMQRLVLDSDLASDQREYLQMGQQAAASLLSLLNDILDFSKIEAGRLDLAPTAFPTVRLTRHLHTIFSTRAQQKNIRLELVPDPGLPDILEADEARIQQILVNLTGNALKFTDQGSITVTLSAGAISPGSCDLCVSVRDTGCGIPPAAQRNIFESFRQADAFTSRRYGGTGLGLSISAKLAELMKGELWLHLSTPEGSDFRFRIPCRVPAPAQTPDPIPLPGSAPATLSPGSLRLLVAEDNTVNQLLIRRLLERAGHSPILAANGRIAVDLFSQKGFDAVLMDVQMPEMDGLEATAAIRCRENANALPRIPIIGLTAHSLKGDRERFLQAGMDECLTKPVQFEELLAALDRYCPSLQAKE